MLSTRGETSNKEALIMKLEIISRNYKVSDHLKSVIADKVEKFARYFEDDAVMKVSLKQIGKDKYGMEITVFFSGNNIVRSEVISDNMYNNIDVALPKIEGQIRKYRTKLGKKIKQSAIDEMAPAEKAEIPSDKVVRKKNFALHKMSVSEAIAEMDLVDHTFYVFLNEENGMVNVVYRREDGGCGLIDLVY